MLISLSKYQSMATSRCHDNQSSYRIRTKKQQHQQKQLSIAQPIDAMCEIFVRIGLTASEEVSFENVDRRTDDGRKTNAVECLDVP